MNFARFAAVSGLAVSLAASLGGCASYATYPAVPKNIALNDTNSLSMTQVMTTGLTWVVEKYPPVARSEGLGGDAAGDAGAFAINLPEPTNRRTYERVADNVGHGARPLCDESSHLPIYHVSYVRIRGDEAQVHVVRPVATLGNDATGAPVVQEIKLQLRGGMSPWHVIGAREWQVGAAEVPPLNFYHPAPEPAKPLSSKPVPSSYVPNPTANPRITAPVTATAPEAPSTPE
jgi:hypothetical protein